jgi:hypothetical protein
MYRMGKKTSVYLSDALLKSVELSGRPLADLIQLGLSRGCTYYVTMSTQLYMTVLENGMSVIGWEVIGRVDDLLFSGAESTEDWRVQPTVRLKVRDAFAEQEYASCLVDVYFSSCDDDGSCTIYDRKIVDAAPGLDDKVIKLLRPIGRLQVPR